MKRWHVFTPIAVAVALFSTLALSQYGGGYSGRGGAVLGPVSSTDNAIARFDGTNGKVVQDSSGVTIDDSDTLSIETLNTPMLQTRHSDTATSGSGIAIRRSRGTTIGGNTIVQDNDVLGNLNFMGADGTNFEGAAIIRGEVDGAPSDGTDMPGALVFLTTPDGSATATEAMRISSSQKATFIDDVTADSFIPTDNVGAIVSGTSITNRGDGVVNTVTITVTSVALTVGNSATLAVGLNLWDLPAGNITITSAFMSVAIDAGSVTITNDTPDVGLGIVIGSSTNALLSDLAGSENILTGQTMTDSNGAVTIASVATHLNVLTGGAHTVHLNFADIWGANTDAVAAITGVVRITYIFNEA